MCQLSPDIGDQANCKGERDHEVLLVTCKHSTRSHLFREDDAKWPEKNKDGRQELEIRLGNEHISFEVYKRSIPKIMDAK